MNKPPSDSITQLLALWNIGHSEAFERLITAVYDELQRIAHGLLKGERQNHTLQTGALVHEAYLRLSDLKHLDWQDRRHFYAIASSQMRRVLVDYARRGRAEKRGGSWLRVTLDEPPSADADAVDVLALDMALQRLAERDVVQARLVELRYFGGLTVAQTAESLDISPATVKRKWTLAQAWLYRELYEA